MRSSRDSSDIQIRILLCGSFACHQHSSSRHGGLASASRLCDRGLFPSHLVQQTAFTERQYNDCRLFRRTSFSEIFQQTTFTERQYNDCRLFRRTSFSKIFQQTTFTERQYNDCRLVLERMTRLEAKFANSRRQAAAAAAAA
jgi:hypothetical protein